MYVKHQWVDYTCLACGLDEEEFEERAAQGPLPSCPGDLDTIVLGYRKCAVWSTHDEDGEPLDTRFSDDVDDWDQAALDTVEAEVRDFLELLDRQDVPWRDLEPEQVGHDFWLTRNRHGAGFWDRGLGERGDTLTTWAQSYGEQNLDVGDDGLLHLM